MNSATTRNCCSWSSLQRGSRSVPAQGLERRGLFTVSSEDEKYESCPKSQGLELYPSPALGTKSKELRENRSSPTQFPAGELCRGMWTSASRCWVPAQGGAGAEHSSQDSATGGCRQLSPPCPHPPAGRLLLGAALGGHLHEYPTAGAGLRDQQGESQARLPQESSATLPARLCPWAANQASALSPASS